MHIVNFSVAFLQGAQSHSPEKLGPWKVVPWFLQKWNEAIILTVKQIALRNKKNIIPVKYIE